MRFFVVQMRLLMQKKAALFTLFGMTLAVLVHYVMNVAYYAGTDVVEMIHPAQLLLLNFEPVYVENKLPGRWIVQMFPFLAVIPAAFSYWSDKKSGEELFWISRVGKKTYLQGKTAAVFAVTFLVFAAPLLLELPLNLLAFPVEAKQNALGYSLCEGGVQDYVSMYLFSNLYHANPYVYAVVCCVLFGLCAALCACFVFAFSVMFRVKIRAFLFLPVYLIFTLIDYFSGTYTETYTVFYFSFYDSSAKSEAGMWIFFFLLAAAGLLMLATARGKDVLQS